MENILTALTALAVLVIVTVILIYNRFDRFNFRIEQLLKHYREPLDDWVRECGELVPGCDEAYFKAKRPRARVECIRQMIKDVKAGSGEVPEPSGYIADFRSSYNALAEGYDRQLASVLLGPVGRLTGQRPWGKLDFC